MSTKYTYDIMPISFYLEIRNESGRLVAGGTFEGPDGDHDAANFAEEYMAEQYVKEAQDD